MQRRVSEPSIVFCWLPTVFLVAVLLAKSDVFGKDEATLKRVKSEAPKGWAKIAEFYDSVMFSVDVKDVNAPRPIPSRKVFVLGNSVREEVTADVPGRGVGRSVEIFNAIYRASALDPGTGAFGLRDVNHRLPDDERHTTGNGLSYSLARPSLTVAGIYIPEALSGFDNYDSSRSWAYILEDAKAITGVDGNELVVLELGYANRDSDGNLIKVSQASKEHLLASKTCTLVLSPARNWAALEFTDEVDRYFDDEGGTSRMVKSCKFEYGDHGFHPLNKTEYFCPRGYEQQSSRTYKFSEPQQVSLDDSFFTLSSIGLPEPTQFFPKSRLKGWWFVVGLGMAIVGVVIFRSWRSHPK